MFFMVTVAMGSSLASILEPLWNFLSILSRCCIFYFPPHGGKFFRVISEVYIPTGKIDLITKGERMALSASLERRVFDSILGAIGDTPLVKLGRIGRDLPVPLYSKLEFMNPGGSVKDRVGAYIIEGAEKRGELKPGGTIVEATSGNTGVGLAIVAALKGYKTIFVMPDKMSEEKIRLLRAFGARVVITPTAVEPDDPRSYYSVARRLADETPNAVLADQYHNMAN